jgi:UDP-4-amino-4,6-dideoxy-N-acetyl-beta-L-altrosamine transaminase
MTSQPFLPYGRQLVDDDDIAAVTEVLRGDWLTTGPAVDRFEAALANEVGAQHAIVCNSGTAALYLAARASGLVPGDAVIVPAITFVASASANVLAGLEVVFADVDPDTGLMDVAHAAEALDRAKGKRVKAILPVHLAGRVGDPAAIRAFADRNGLLVIEDACHALGTRYGNAAYRVGECAHGDAACFSFHPVKAIAMGEGGAITTNSPEIAERSRRLRNHGMNRQPELFANPVLGLAADGDPNPWYYEVAEISHNFRVSDINCALGLAQLRKLARFCDARAALMAQYRRRLLSLEPELRFVPPAAGIEPGWHLCTVLVEFESIGIDRGTLMQRLKARGVGTQVHYIPVHLQPFYHARYGAIELPGASAYYRRTLTLPLFPGMTDADVDFVVEALTDSLGRAQGRG